MQANQPPTVFISHAGVDKETTKRAVSLAAELRTKEIDARIAELRKDLSQAEPDWICSMIQKSRFVLVVSDQHYKESPHGKFVLRFVSNHVFQQGACNSKFIPVLVNHQNTKPDRDIPTVLQGYTYYDFRKHNAAAQHGDGRTHGPGNDAMRQLFKQLTLRLLGKEEKVNIPALGKPKPPPPLKKAGSLFSD